MEAEAGLAHVGGTCFPGKVAKPPNYGTHRPLLISDTLGVGTIFWSWVLILKESNISGVELSFVLGVDPLASWSPCQSFDLSSVAMARRVF